MTTLTKDDFREAVGRNVNCAYQALYNIRHLRMSPTCPGFTCEQEHKLRQVEMMIQEMAPKRVKQRRDAA